MIGTANTSIEALQARTDNDLRLYALVDAAHTVVSKDIESYCHHYEALGLFKGLPEQAAQAAGPYLLPLNPFEESHHARLAWLISIENQAPCLSWLWSPDASPTLFNHLQAQLFAELPSQQQALLRFYDPRVLQQLLTLLTPEQLHQLAGSISHWWWALPEQGRITHQFEKASS